ncbi:DNA-binding MurR/RpiR family transcriptional regulator [Kitasatospora sp. MAA4]|uniref:MurR/RpiR family transcriptional regulator n=1 Tax=Kitasatospora sp. MAA4 TaxID=3035093 RepID=UPI002475F92E|nr:MurR/RpiR family transcriptional regulator [Kitasatospora sp. MAA4]MDH6137771.1 DNA-binding MurR/RpiR family transcriptional regulator [Kitasatospora sp. MAA4]
MATGPLAEEIRRRLGECSPAERKVGRVLLAGWPAAGFETIATIAERAAVSAPTVLRFVTRLGYHGFPDFQSALRQELDERNASPLSLYESSLHESSLNTSSQHTLSQHPSDGTGETATGEDAGPAALLRQGGGVFTAAVSRTLAELTPHDLERAITLLADRKRRITLAGGRFTQLLAQYLGLHLMQLRDDVRFLSERDVERTATLASLGRRDVLVLFDYRRYEQDKVTLAELVQETGGKVVLFTDTWLSPVAPQAEVVLPSQVTTLSPYDSLVPTLAVIETVITGVLTALGDDGRRRLSHTEDIARRTGQH